MDEFPTVYVDFKYKSNNRSVYVVDPKYNAAEIQALVSSEFVDIDNKYYNIDKTIFNPNTRRLEVLLEEIEKEYY